MIARLSDNGSTIKTTLQGRENRAEQSSSRGFQTTSFPAAADTQSADEENEGGGKSCQINVPEGQSAKFPILFESKD